MDDDETALPREIKLAIAICFALLIAFGLLTLLDMQLKRSMVDTAATFRKEVEHARGQRTGTPPPARVPGAVPGVHGVGAVGGDGAGAQEDGAAVEAAPVVRPGDESARPPRRGGVDGA